MKERVRKRSVSLKPSRSLIARLALSRNRVSTYVSVQMLLSSYMIQSSWTLLALYSAWWSSLGSLVSGQTLFNQPTEYFSNSTDPVSTQFYLDWVDTTLERYDASLFLSAANNASNGVAVHWSVRADTPDTITDNATSTTLRLAVAAPASGWVAFGLSENGGMSGSDVVVFEAAQPDRLRDMHILDTRAVMDDVCNDWTLIEAHLAENFVIFEATRVLDTGDPQDRIIFPDADTLIASHRIIAAWGNDESVSYHKENKARGAIRWFGEGAVEALTFEQTMRAVSIGSFEVRAVDHPVKTIDTEYAEFCLGRGQILAQTGLDGSPDSLTIVGMEPIIDPSTSQFVHHFTVYTSPNANEDGVVPCDDREYFELIYVWAPGEYGFALPLNVGATYGPNVAQSFRLQIHYDNPSLIADAVDNSGVRFYFSKQPRKHAMGVLQLGDPFVGLEGQTVGAGWNKHDFTCSGSCATMALGEEPVTVIREFLHMHQAGVRASNKQIRDGRIVRSSAIDYFSFAQQGNQAVQQDPFQIFPGDEFKTSCFYKGNTDTVFGISSQEEMCIAFLFYFPRKRISGLLPWLCAVGYDHFVPACESQWSSLVLSTTIELERIFGTVPEESQCLLKTTPVEIPTKAPVAVSNSNSIPNNKPANSSESTLDPTSGAVERESSGLILDFDAICRLLLPMTLLTLLIF